MPDLYTWYIIAVVSLVTVLLRFLPFLIFNEKIKTPKIIEKLGKILPYAIMGTLVVYCLKNLNFINISNWVPQLIACVVVGILYVWKRNTLISVICGTICHMILVQLVF